MKILVPTDFSATSRVGVKFAINWGQQQRMELVFIHVLFYGRPNKHDPEHPKFIVGEETLAKNKLQTFVSETYRKLNIKPGKHRFELVEGLSPDLAIMDYCRQQNDISYICICTAGAGKIKRIFGTNTGNLITKSDIPVIAVPKNYRITPIKTLMYATDNKNLSEELQQVVSFARPLKVPIQIFHFVWPQETSKDIEILKWGIQNKFSYPITFYSKDFNLEYSLIKNLQKVLRKFKPSILIMFTNKNRTFFEKFFLSSKSEQLTFDLKVPLLTFAK